MILTLAEFESMRAEVEPHRHDCEVKFLVELPTNAHRSAYLEGVRRNRGREAAEKLRSDTWAQMQKL